MILKDLAFTGLRNLQDTKLSLATNINLFLGANGSGKTSVLEAVYWLAFGRSMRQSATHHHAIAYDRDLLQVKGSTVDGDTIFLERTTKKTSIELNQSSATIADIAKIMPVQLLNHQSFQLIGEKDWQRKRIDWGVFHVEHRFLEAWRSYKKGLKQRNALLKTQDFKEDMLYVWDAALQGYAAQITDYRNHYMQQFLPQLEKILDTLGVQEVSVSLDYGWDQEQELAELWLREVDRDRSRGYTGKGPHRAHLDICIENKKNKIKVAEVLSRGQQKLLVYAFSLAQCSLLTDGCIYLIDDILAELDVEHGHAIIDTIVQQQPQTQVLLASLDEQAMLQYRTTGNTFHLNAGSIK